MRRLRIFLLTTSVQLVVGLGIGRAVDCKPSLDDLIAKIPQVATGGGGISPAEVELAKHLQNFGPTSVARLVGLLDSDDKRVRDFAGYVVRDLDGLTESDLDALFRARLRGDGWIPPAIARVGTPRAIAFLVDDIRRKPERGTQVTWALAGLGEKVAPALAAVFRERTPVGQELSDALAEVFSDMGTKAKIAVPLLIDVATDQTLPAVNRCGAIKALGSIGLGAAEAVPTLKQLAKSESADVTDAAKRAILGIGTTDAAEILIAQLQSASPGLSASIVLRDIAALHENGRAAGPEVVRMLYRDDWEGRVDAALTLGYIGYGPASGDLKRMLMSNDDWRLVYAATLSLGRMKDHSALPELGQLTRNHWSPVVRKAALKAINVIQGTEVYEPRWQPANFAFEYFGYQSVGYGPAAVRQKSWENLHFRTDPDVLSPSELNKITYSIKVAGYDEQGRHVERHDAKPCCGLRFGKGVLLGGDRGEWGGELAYQDETGVTRDLVQINTHAIHRMPFGVVAAVGLAHITMNSGYLYLITEEPGKPPIARPWKALPGSPMKSGILENGDLFVSCVGGDVLITPSGEFRRAE